MVRRADVAATMASVVVLTGVQGMAPALLSVRDSFGLDDSGVASMTIGYLAAAAVLAAPVAALADRLGERRVLVASLLVFGLAGGVVATTSDFGWVIGARTVQGAAFGVVLAVTISVTGHGLDPLPFARAQSVRVVAMSLAEVVLPVAVGVLMDVASWRVAAAMSLSAIPVAVFCAFALPGRAVDVTGGVSGKRGLGPALSALRTPFGAAIQVPGFMRFLLKFSLLTYWPLYAADHYGMTSAAVGLALSMTAVASIAGAWATPVLLRRWQVARLTLIGMLLAAAPLVLVTAAPSAAVLTLLIVVSGVGDGVLGVVNNLSASAAAPDEGRSAFFGVTGTIRNFGKLSALAVVGGAMVLAPLGAALVVVGAMGVASTAVVPVIARGPRPD